MGRRKFRLGRLRKNAERKLQQLKLREPGRPKKQWVEESSDAVSNSLPNEMVKLLKLNKE